MKKSIIEKKLKKVGIYQYKAHADSIYKNGYSIVRIGNDWKYSRIIYIKNGIVYEDGKFNKLLNTVNLIKGIIIRKENTIIKRIKKLSKKYSIKIDWDAILSNALTDGYSTKRLCRKNLSDKEFIELMEKISSSHYRHTYTNYDLINKKNLTDYELRELRRQKTAIAGKSTHNIRAKALKLKLELMKI